MRLRGVCGGWRLCLAAPSAYLRRPVAWGGCLAVMVPRRDVERLSSAGRVRVAVAPVAGGGLLPWASEFSLGAPERAVGAGWLARMGSFAVRLPGRLADLLAGSTVWVMLCAEPACPPPPPRAVVAGPRMVWARRVPLPARLAELAQAGPHGGLHAYYACRAGEELWVEGAGRAEPVRSGSALFARLPEDAPFRAPCLVALSPGPAGAAWYARAASMAARLPG